MTQKKEIPFQALIFDMDGTMIDNMMVHHRAWQQKLSSLGLELTLEEVRRDIHGINEEIIKRLFGDRFNTEEIAQIAWEKEEAYREIYTDSVAFLPGLETFLETAKKLKVPMGIGTAAPKENAEFLMKALDLSRFFNVLVHSGMVRRGKPDPEVFGQVAGQLGLPLKESLVFEDSPTGAQASANGGASTVVLTTTHTEEEFIAIPNTAHFTKDFTGFEIKEDITGKAFVLRV